MAPTGKWDGKGKGTAVKETGCHGDSGHTGATSSGYNAFGHDGTRRVSTIHSRDGTVWEGLPIHGSLHRKIVGIT